MPWSEHIGVVEHVVVRRLAGGILGRGREHLDDVLLGLRHAVELAADLVRPDKFRPYRAVSRSSISRTISRQPARSINELFSLNPDAPNFSVCFAGVLNRLVYIEFAASARLDAVIAPPSVAPAKASMSTVGSRNLQQFTPGDFSA